MDKFSRIVSGPSYPEHTTVESRHVAMPLPVGGKYRRYLRVTVKPRATTKVLFKTNASHGNPRGWAGNKSNEDGYFLHWTDNARHGTACASTVEQSTERAQTVAFVVWAKRDNHKSLMVCGRDGLLHKCGNLPQTKRTSIPLIAEMLGIGAEWMVELRS